MIMAISFLIGRYAFLWVEHWAMSQNLPVESKRQRLSDKTLLHIICCIRSHICCNKYFVYFIHQCLLIEIRLQQKVFTPLTNNCLSLSWASIDIGCSLQPAHLSKNTEAHLPCQPIIFISFRRFTSLIICSTYLSQKRHCLTQDLSSIICCNISFTICYNKHSVYLNHQSLLIEMLTANISIGVTF